MRRTLIVMSLVLVMALSVVLTGCSITSVENMIGTTIQLKIEGSGARSAEREIYAMIGDVEKSVSTSLDSSLVSRINRSKVGEVIALDSHANTLISSAYEYYRLTQGSFDISVFPLVDLWGFSPTKLSPTSKKAPSDEAIDDTMQKVGLDKAFAYDSEKGTIAKKIDGAMLDLGAVAKGYIADLAKEILDRHKIERAIIDIGGTLYLYGDKAFRVGVRHPRPTDDDIIDVIECDNVSVSTSGDYERYYKDSETGERYHHIIDPESGRPAKAGLVGVTIVSSSAMIADILSTSVFVMGRERGMALIENVKEVSMALFVSETDGECKVEKYIRNNK